MKDTTTAATTKRSGVAGAAEVRDRHLLPCPHPPRRHELEAAFFFGREPEGGGGRGSVVGEVAERDDEGQSLSFFGKRPTFRFSTTSSDGRDFGEAPRVHQRRRGERALEAPRGEPERGERELRGRGSLFSEPPVVDRPAEALPLPRRDGGELPRQQQLRLSLVEAQQQPQVRFRVRQQPRVGRKRGRNRRRARPLRGPSLRRRRPE